MPEGDQQQESLGWRAGLPDDLKGHEAFTPYKTVGDFGKAHIETSQKLKDAEGKLGNSIPRLSENATPEERDKFFASLGRPEKPDGYEFVGEDKAAPEWTSAYKNAMHKMGVPKSMAKELSEFNSNMIDQMVTAHNAKVQADNATAEAGLKTEWGDKYTSNVELVSRLWKKEMDADLDKAFAGESSANRVSMMRFLFKIAAKTGEDNSQRGSAQRSAEQAAFINYDKSPTPPRRVV